MEKNENTFEKGYMDGYKSVRWGAPVAFPPHTVPPGKTPYEWGYEQGVAVARGA
jgi:hypothetical protein